MLPSEGSGTSDGPYTLLECILPCTKINETRSAEDEDPDATEYSSSFADTTSDTERCSGLSEAELDSQFFGDRDLASPYDAFDVIFQTSTAFQFKFQGKIIGLRFLLSRSCLHKGIFLSGKNNLFCFEAIILLENDLYNDVQKSRAFSSFEGFCSKSMSLSFSNEFCRRKAIKRRKSKRVEDITDAALHVTNHNPFHLSRYKLLLSRVAYENKRSNPEGTSEIDDSSNTECLQVFFLREFELLAACDSQASSAPSLASSSGNEDTISGAIFPATHNIPG
ncbi:hypothetical protein DKX38_029764 [Salix brachista]|uniref:Uncharacterized protein n=1 Tax=Salix brachista TaxID=2182728 RepID=A0A5N5J283_9ROSI|nr:hypothetical protein DKX38_029764 [Salix brachista]